MTRNRDAKPISIQREQMREFYPDDEIPQMNPVDSAQSVMKIEYPTIYNGYKQIMDEQFELFCKKHLDYGMGNISQGTNLETPDEKEFAISGLFFRLNDKVNRWKNLLVNKREANNESLVDTYQDITNYGIIAQLVERGLWKK